MGISKYYLLVVFDTGICPQYILATGISALKLWGSWAELHA